MLCQEEQCALSGDALCVAANKRRGAVAESLSIDPAIHRLCKSMGEFRVQEGRFLFISGIKCPSNENDCPCHSEFAITESMQEEANDWPRRL